MPLGPRKTRIDKKLPSYKIPLPIAMSSRACRPQAGEAEGPAFRLRLRSGAGTCPDRVGRLALFVFGGAFSEGIIPTKPARIVLRPFFERQWNSTDRHHRAGLRRGRKGRHRPFSSKRYILTYCVINHILRALLLPRFEVSICVNSSL